MYSKILNNPQKKIIEQLDFLSANVYLAGGTALALQMGHRTSLDLDFFTKEHFDIEIILKNLQERFPNIKITRALKDTLLAEIDGVSFSLFYYPYQLLKPLKVFEAIKVVSLEDIAAMKMIAISMRGKSRDFIDVYFLLKRFNLKEILGFTSKKYPTFQQMSILKGLIYFDDADKEEDVDRGIKIFDKNFNWEIAKREITKNVEEYQNSILRI